MRLIFFIRIMTFNSIFVQTSLLLLFIFAAREVMARGTILEDISIQAQRDFVPNLGRGYSLSSGSFFGTCVDADDVGATSYDYRIDGNYAHAQSEVAGVAMSFSNSISYHLIKERMLQAYDLGNEGLEHTKHFAIVQMVIDKYYTTMTDDHPAIGDNILSMLSNKNFLEFVVTCGPTYIRSQRRSTEFVILIEVNLEKDDDHSWFFNIINTDLNGFIAGSAIDDEDAESGTKAFSSHWDLFIQCFSFGLDIEDSEPYIIPRFDDLIYVLEDGFAASTSSGDTGIIRSIEVVPWTSHLEFMTAVDLQLRMHVEGTSRSLYTIPASIKHFNFMANTEHIQQIMGITGGMLGSLNKLIECTRVLSDASAKTLETSWVRNKSMFLPPNHLAYSTKPPPMTGTFTLGSHEANLIQGARLKHLLLRQNNLLPEGEKYLVQRVIKQIHAYIDNYVTPCFYNFQGVNLYGSKLFTKNWMDMTTCNNLLCQMPDTVWGANGCEMSGLGSWTSLVGTFCLPEFVEGSISVLDEGWDDGVNFDSGTWTL
mmetsp:Transcript_10846/g.23828  ORF Transcript_10846/g.23828 Transcript_10846/m.23828 type:complete len:538 (-) Transcript_10846:179-1792(-)